MRGLILENIANLYRVQVKGSNKINVYEAIARGKFRKDEISPVVGDFVELEIVDEEKRQAVIERIENRNAK